MYCVFQAGWVNDSFPLLRMELFAKLLSLPSEDLPDILCIQEMFDPECARILMSGALNELYTSVVYPAGKHFLPILGQNSGLLIASRFKILDARFISYGNHIGSDYWAAKGALCACLELRPDLRMVVMNTHGQANPDTEMLWKFTLNAHARCERIRKENYTRAASFADAFAKKHNAHVSLYTGDFNIIAENNGTKTSEFKSLTSWLGNPRDVFRELHSDAAAFPGLTYSHAQNVWAVGSRG